MPNCASWLSLCAGLLLALCPLPGSAGDYAAQVRYADLNRHGDKLEINALIDYTLSPTAKEALLKGVPLEWRLLIEIREPAWPWDGTLIQISRPFKLQYHALLNQFAVQLDQQRAEMFLSLNAALDYLSQLHIETSAELPANSDLLLAVKTQFRREALPVPLRPFAYLDPQWYLSSDWFLWSIPN